jgi:hypothetical protein
VIDVREKQKENACDSTQANSESGSNEIDENDSQYIGCPTSGVAQRAMREAAPYARGVNKARQL